MDIISLNNFGALKTDKVDKPAFGINWHVKTGKVFKHCAL